MSELLESFLLVDARVFFLLVDAREYGFDDPGIGVSTGFMCK
jgi:hypothetical protein